jgi:hypothetical protein
MTEAAQPPVPSWQTYKSTPPKANELSNPDLPKLNDQDEYVWALQRVSLKQDVPKPGAKAANGENCDLFYTIWQEEGTKNLLMVKLRVDQLGDGWKRAKTQKFERGIVQFFDRIGLPITEGKAPDFGNLFIMGMRFRGRVDVGLTDGKPNGYYHLNIATVRRYMQ